MAVTNHSDISTNEISNHGLYNKLYYSNLSLLNSALAADFCSGVVEGVASNLNTDTGSFVFLCVPVYNLNTDLKRGILTAFVYVATVPLKKFEQQLNGLEN